MDKYITVCTIWTRNRTIHLHAVIFREVTFIFIYTQINPIHSVHFEFCWSTIFQEYTTHICLFNLLLPLFKNYQFTDAWYFIHLNILFVELEMIPDSKHISPRTNSLYIFNLSMSILIKK